MRSLIERLEVSPEPSRDLSDLVLLAIGWLGIDPARAGILIPHWRAPDGRNVSTHLRPHPTGNLADAASLVPPGRPWALLVYENGWASAGIGESGELGAIHQAGPAMALTIAACEEREIADAWHA